MTFDSVTINASNLVNSATINASDLCKIICEQNHYEIIQVNILKENKVVSCVFADGDTQKAVCDEQDQFSLENGIAVCVAKHAMGGSRQYNKAIRQGLRVFEEQERAKADFEERKRIEENHRRKHARYLDRKKKRAREARVQEMAEAFKLALKESK